MIKTNSSKHNAVNFSIFQVSIGICGEDIAPITEISTHLPKKQQKEIIPDKISTLI